MPSNRDRIYVCQSSTCRGKGSDAVLVEIEELANLVGNCEVKSTGCMGYCSRGPAVGIRRKRSSKYAYHLRVNTFEKSAKVVKDASGQEPRVEDLPPDSERRLREMRATNERKFLVSTHQWNKALSGLAEKATEDTSLRPELERILSKAGYTGIHAHDLLKPSRPLEMPSAIENYVHWVLQSVEVVTAHSAISKFATDDLKRGTPHPRGSGRMAKPVTWHVTMLGAVGANGEGPLPWIERDYTPISSALEWERGRCEILIKIYSNGQLTSWLDRLRTAAPADDTRIWLSRPIKTLSVPSLATAEGGGEGFQPASVLLLLAGTEIVALPQIIAHREPIRLLGIPTNRSSQLPCPIDLIQSCREDDLLLLPQIKEYCVEGMKKHPKFRGLRDYTLLLTKKSQNVPGTLISSGENDSEVDCDAIFKDVPNATTIKSQRLNRDIVANAVGRLLPPYRVVVSGPDAFNNAAREFLNDCGVDSNYLTVLSA